MRREGVAAEIEDALEVTAHQEAVGELAERPEEDRVADGVAHLAAAVAIGLELVGVLPERVGPRT